MLDLEPRHLELVKTIIRRHVPHARLIAFGSRVKGTAKKFSDLDLALEADRPLTMQAFALLEADLEESDLPIKVDVIDMRTISPQFRARVEREGSEIPLTDH
jgi:uncharacterized protein